MLHYSPTKALRPYHNVRAMLKGIPRQLWSIFLPASADEIALLERNILAFRSREIDREKVITIQKMSEFPLRPNAPLREMLTKIRIRDMKRGKLKPGGKRKDKDGNIDTEDDDQQPS